MALRNLEDKQDQRKESATQMGLSGDEGTSSMCFFVQV